MKSVLAFLSVVSLFLLSSCAHHVDVSQCIQTETIYGFWGGFWHGITAPFALLSMLWSDHVVYAVNNNGGWYAFGFCMGSGIFAALMKMIFATLRAILR